MIMSKRKAGDFVESVADFWLGMAGAAAHGFGELTKRRQARKDNKSGDGDIVDDFTVGMQAAFEQAQTVVKRAVKDLAPHVGEGENGLSSHSEDEGQPVRRG
jgi:hypothetical protein